MAKKSHDAKGSVAGYIFQLERLLYWLCNGNSGSVVSIEAEDDIVVRLKQGEDLETIYEQDKHTLSKNTAFTDHSVALWKTLSIWAESVINKDVVLESAWFCACSNRKVDSGKLLRKIADANTKETAAKVVTEIRGFESKATTTNEIFIKKVLTLTNDQLVDLVMRTRVSDKDYSHSTVGFKREIFDALSLSNKLPKDDIMWTLKGYVEDEVMKAWRNGETAWLKVDSFRNLLTNLISQYNEKTFIESSIDLLPVSQRQIKDNRARVFAKQLDSISCDQGDFPLVKKLWKLMLTGSYSVAAIVREAKRIGLRSHNGQPLSKQAFFNMFQNEFYHGYFYWRTEEGERVRHLGKHRKMICERDYFKVQAILSNGGNSYPERGINKFSYTGLIDCGECGRSVTAERVYQGRCPNCKHKFSIKHRSVCPLCSTDLNNCLNVSKIDRTYYQCTKYGSNCSQKTIQPSEIEKQVVDILKEVSIDKDFYVWIVQCIKDHQEEAEKDVQAELTVMKKRRTELTTRLASLVKMRADNEISAEEMTDARKSTLADIAQVESLIAKKQDDSVNWTKISIEVLHTAAHAVEAFKKASEDDKKTMIRNLLSNLTLKDKKLYYTTNQTISIAQECMPVYNSLKATIEPEKSIATYSELGLSDPLRQVLCRRLESNQHSRRNTILSRARLPIPPLRHVVNTMVVQKYIMHIFSKVSTLTVCVMPMLQ